MSCTIKILFLSGNFIFSLIHSFLEIPGMASLFVFVHLSASGVDLIIARFPPLNFPHIHHILNIKYIIKIYYYILNYIIIFY